MIEDNRDARTWAVLCHLSALVMLLGRTPWGTSWGPS